MAVSLDRAKMHLRVNEYDGAGNLLPGDEDELIELFIAASTRWALGFCRLDDVPAGAEAEFDAAVLLTMASMYENRESDITGTIHTEIPTARRLIDPYRRMSV